MLTDYFMQNPKLFTQRKIYTPTPRKGQPKVEVRCTTIIPVNVTEIAGLKKSASSVTPTADENDNLLSLAITGNIVYFIGKL